jgi:excisionase family DNA binding protein
MSNVEANTGAGTQLVHRPERSMLEVSHGDRLLNVAEVAEILGLSERTVWRWRNQKRMPQGITIGRVVRWSYRAIMEWIAAGCPASVEMERSV